MKTFKARIEISEKDYSEKFKFLSSLSSRKPYIISRAVEANSKHEAKIKVLREFPNSKIIELIEYVSVSQRINGEEYTYHTPKRKK